MTDFIRQQIVDKAANRLRQIQIDNGSATDIGLNAYWWRRRPLHDDQLPAVIGFDTDEQVTGEGASTGMKKHYLTLEIEICAKEDESDELVRAAMDDIAKMESDQSWLAGLPVNTNAYCEVVAATMQVEEAETRQAAARVTLMVEYQAPRGSI